MRTPMIAGNWKMNLTRSQARELALSIKKGLDPDIKHEILLIPSFTNLETVKDVIHNSKILLGAQNVFWEENGAFTGEISPLQLKDIGCDYVIIGHSERRKILFETDEMLNKKIKAALRNDLKVIFCLGETLEERENNQTYRVLQLQLQNGLKDIEKKELNKIIIAYEPVWAIGTGKTATGKQAEDAHIFIRKEISRLYDSEIANSIRIIYGGSVKAENIDELMAQENIDGVLVGGESLKADKFLRIIHYNVLRETPPSLSNPDASCMELASMIDHTLLKPDATHHQIEKLCHQARQYHFASVCVNPAYVSLAKRLLAGSNVKVCTVIGFPLGSTTPTVKAIEAREAIANGADEIDMVINIGALKSGNDSLVLEDIKAVREATRGKVLKVIIETAYLTREEKIRACKLAKKAQADFVKTSTGFGPGGATVEDVKLMREVVGPNMGVKASGGIRDCKTAWEMVKAGATRLGTSASIAIVEGKKSEDTKY